MKYFFIAFILFSIAACKPSQKSVSGKPAAVTSNTNPESVSSKPNAELLETYWKLVELNGKPVVQGEKMKKEIRIILKKEGNRVTGFSGCNTLMGTFELKEGNRITFSSMASTKMACPDMETEAAFNKVLKVVDNYAINGDILILAKARMAPMARFEAVYLRK